MTVLLLSIIQWLIDAYIWILIIYALLSWFPGAYQSSLGRIVIRLAEPFMSLIDRYIPPIGGISFNVIIGIVILQLVSSGVEFLFSFF